VSGGHAHAVDPSAPLDGPIERLAPQAKIVGTVAFVVAVVATPAHAVWPYVLQLAIVGAVAVVALLPWRTVARRLVFEVPFVLLAVALVVFGGEPRLEVGPVSVSEPGLWSAWTMLARSTLGVLAASVLAATTTADELLAGLARLRLPHVITQISAFAVRYLVVLRDELERVRLAQALRSGGRRARPRDVAAAGAVLFVRSFERGERVHLAMTARSPSPTPPSSPAPRPRGAAPAVVVVDPGASSPSIRTWAVALAPGALAAVVAAWAWGAA